MILQRLVEHYDRLAANSEEDSGVPRPGFSREKISFCLVIRPDLSAYLQDVRSAGGRRPVPQKMSVPHYGEKRTSNPRPYFLWDSTEYVLGGGKNVDQQGRYTQRFELFRKFHLDLRPDVGCDAFDILCSFLTNWDPADAYALEGWQEAEGSNLVLKLEGEHRFLHEVPACQSAWLRFLDSRAGKQGHSLISGRSGPIARLHPAIKGVHDPGGQAEKGIVAFNRTAFESFRKEQGDNAPILAEEARKYAAVLNHLLARRDHRAMLGDTTIVFWAEQQTGLEQFVSDLFDDQRQDDTPSPVESAERVRQTRLFLSQLRDGMTTSTAIDENDKTRFFILGLSPSTSRISIRFWADNSVAELKRALRLHMRDTDIVGADELPPLTVKRIVDATGRAEFDDSHRFTGKYDAKKVPPSLVGEVGRSILTRTPYPQTLLTAMLRRIRADNEVSEPRIAAVKACLNRNGRLRGHFQEVTVALDPDRNDSAYLAGRLFALLEKAQSDSARTSKGKSETIKNELNSTIKDRFFSSASMTPSVVFPRLLRLSQHHLAKMETGRKIYFEKQIGDVIARLDGFPRHLNLEDQGLFAIGYFHQRHDLFTSKKNNSEEPPNE